MSRQRTAQLAAFEPRHTRPCDNHDVETRQLRLALPKPFANNPLYAVSIDRSPGRLFRHRESETAQPVSATTRKHREQGVARALRSGKHPIEISAAEQSCRRWETMRLAGSFQVRRPLLPTRSSLESDSSAPERKSRYQLCRA